MIMQVEFLSPQEYAARFGLRLRTVYRWVQESKLPRAALPKGTRAVRIIVGNEQGQASNVLPFRRKTR